jgi:hypothetical protein
MNAKCRPGVPSGQLSVVRCQLSKALGAKRWLAAADRVAVQLREALARRYDAVDLGDRARIRRDRLARTKWLPRDSGWPIWV